MKGFFNKDFWFSTKGLLLIICITLLIIVPTLETFLKISFSKVFPILLVEIWYVLKDIVYEKKEKFKIVFEIFLSILIIAICYYFI